MAVDALSAGYAEASKLSTVKQHANPADPPCPHFGTCGGCDFQELYYTAQLDAKQAQVAETFQHIGGIRNCNDILLPIMACQQTYHYRNNMQFTFGTSQTDSAFHTDKPGTIVIGLHKANQPSQITPIQTCYLQHSSANTLLQAVSSAVALAAAGAAETPLTAFDPVTQQGFLRQLILRKSSQGEYMVIISTSFSQPDLLQPLVTALLSCNMPVASIINTVVPCQSIAKRRHRPSRRKATLAAAAGQRSLVMHGKPTITEQLCGLQFQISPSSFFQVNSNQAAVLYNLVLQFAGKAKPTQMSCCHERSTYKQCSLDYTGLSVACCQSRHKVEPTAGKLSVHHCACLCSTDCCF